MRHHQTACAVSTELARHLPICSEQSPYRVSWPEESFQSVVRVGAAILTEGHHVGTYSIRVHLNCLTRLAVLALHLQRGPLARRSELALSVSALDTSLKQVRSLPPLHRIPDFEAWVSRRRQTLVSHGRLLGFPIW